MTIDLLRPQPSEDITDIVRKYEQSVNDRIIEALTRAWAYDQIIGPIVEMK